MSAHQTISDFAYALWEARGSPIGSPLVDWLEAERQITSATSNVTPVDGHAKDSNRGSGSLLEPM